MKAVLNVLKASTAVLAYVGVLGTATVVGVNHYFNTVPITVQYYGEIGGDTQYFNILSVLREAHEGQRVDIYMNSPGGSVIHGNEIAAAMKDSKGTVVYHVGSFAASMAAVLACQADELDLAPQAVVMYHTVQTSGGAIVNPSEPDMIAFVNAAKTLTKNCTFLTQAEQDSIWSGGEVWLNGDEINKRLAAKGE